MAVRIEIICEGIKLDLLPGTEKDFYITLVNHELSDLETRNGTYSKEVRLPRTSVNSNFFGIFGSLIASKSTKAYRRVQVEIIVDGIPLQRGLEGLYLGIENNQYKFQIFGSNASFFDDLADSFIGDLDLSEVDFNMTVANVTSKMASTDNKLCTPYLDWLNWDSGVAIETDIIGIANFLTDYNIRYAGFGVHAKWLIQKIIESVGYSVDYTAINNTVFNNLLLMAPVFQFVALPNPNLAIGNYQKGNSQTVVAVSTPERISFTIQLTAPVGSAWSGSPLYQYSFTTSAIVDITLKLAYTYVYNPSGNGATWVGIYKNTTGLAYKFFTSADTGSGTITIQATGIQVNNGDVIYVLAIVRNIAGAPADTLTITTLSEFGYLEQSSSNTLIDVEKWLPKIEQKNFIKAICKIFNFIIDVNSVTQTIAFYDFDDVFTSEPQDLSEFIDLSQDPKISTQFGPLGINSRFKWGRDSDIQRLDGDANYISSNLTLPPDEVIIELDGFSLSDQSPFRATRNGATKIKHPNFVCESLGIQGQVSAPSAGTAFNIKDANGAAIKGGDFRVGDYLHIPSLNRTYYINTLSASNSAGTTVEAFTAALGNTDYQVWRYNIDADALMPRLVVLVNSAANRYVHDGKDQSTTATVSNALEAQFPSSIQWDTLMTNYYAKLLNMLDRVVRLQVWAYLPSFVVYNISLVRRVYIRQYDSYFYVNKIEQWKPTSKVRLDLILMTKDYNLTA